MAVSLSEMIHKVLTPDFISESEIGIHRAHSPSQLMKVFEILSKNKTVKVFSLSGGNELKRCVIDALAKMLRENNTLTTLNIANNFLSHFELIPFLNALLNNSTITSMNLTSLFKGTGSDSEEMIAAFLTNSTSLTTLNLSHNELGSRGLKFLPEALRLHPSLTSINLCGNELGFNGTKLILDAISTNPKLTTLGLSYNGLSALSMEDIATRLRSSNSTITSLDVGNNRLLEAEIKILTESLHTNTTLTSLCIRSNFLHTEGTRHVGELLKQNKTITFIDLSSSNISVGIRHLADGIRNNSTLLSLKLFDNAISGTNDEEVKVLSEALKANSTLRELHYSWNYLTNGAGYFADMLKHNVSLTSVDLEHCYIYSEGLRVIADALKQNTTLKTLRLACNRFTLEDAKYLAEALQSNHTLTSIKFEKDFFKDDKSGIAAEINNIMLRNGPIALMRQKIAAFSPYYFSQQPTTISAFQHSINQSAPVSMVHDKGDSKASKDTIETDLKGNQDTTERDIKTKLEFANNKDNVELTLKQRYDQLVAECDNLKTLGVPVDTIALFKDMVLLYYLSWDQGEILSQEDLENSALSKQERIHQLQNLYLSTSFVAIKVKTLSELRIIALEYATTDYAMIDRLSIFKFHEKDNQDTDRELEHHALNIKKDRKPYALLAYICALHGLQDESSNDIACDALRFWFDIDDRELSETRSDLEDRMAKTKADKFLEFRIAYTKQCGTLGITPLPPLKLDPLIEKAHAVVATLSTTRKPSDAADSLDAAEALNATDSLNAADTKSDAEKQRMPVLVQYKLCTSSISPNAVLASTNTHVTSNAVSATDLQLTNSMIKGLDES